MRFVRLIVREALCGLLLLSAYMRSAAAVKGGRRWRFAKQIRPRTLDRQSIRPLQFRQQEKGKDCEKFVNLAAFGQGKIDLCRFRKC